MNSYKCNLCDKIYNVKSFYDRHVKNKHYNYDTNFNPKLDAENDEVPDSTTSNFKSKKHKNINIISRYVCSACPKPKAFFDLSSFRIHVRSHSGEKPYECNICHKNFSRISNLNRHKRIHSGEKPYKCDICNKTFSDSSSLTTHKRHHNNIRPHQCPSCSQAFMAACDLTKHIRIHTGEKPYSCPFCEMSFKRSTHLTSHLKNKHPEQL